jgi:uncharacterized protein YkwD
MRKILLLAIFICGCGVSVFEDNNVCKEYLLLLHNKERCLRDCSQITEDETLNQYAQKHAEWMASRSSLRHSTLSIPNFNYLGENIAMGQPDEEFVLNDWMHSPGHKRNILNKSFSKTGIGYAKSRNGSPYWCVVFGG